MYFGCMLTITFGYVGLDRDPAQRPSAKEALKHPWLRGNSSERSTGKQMDLSVVQRIQRFAQNNRFKRSVLQLIAEELLSHTGAAPTAPAAEEETVCPLGDRGQPIVNGPASSSMLEIYKRLEFMGDAIDRDQAVEALARMGYRLRPSELHRLIEQVDTSGSGKVRRAAFAASQIDWSHLQQHSKAEWLKIAWHAFQHLDRDKDGVLRTSDIICSLRAKLPEDELQATIKQAMHDAGYGEGKGDECLQQQPSSRRRLQQSGLRWHCAFMECLGASLNANTSFSVLTASSSMNHPLRDSFNAVAQLQQFQFVGFC